MEGRGLGVEAGLEGIVDLLRGLNTADTRQWCSGWYTSLRVICSGLVLVGRRAWWNGAGGLAVVPSPPLICVGPSAKSPSDLCRSFSQVPL